jgi:hypothetical protein
MHENFHSSCLNEDPDNPRCKHKDAKSNPDGLDDGDWDQPPEDAVECIEGGNNAGSQAACKRVSDFINKMR